MLVRFVTSSIDPDSGVRQGVFQALYDLLESHDTAQHHKDELEEIRCWFNTKLDIPERFARSEKPNAAPRAICWFKDSAQQHMKQIHRLRRILHENGIQTEMVLTDRPGYVVFEDEHQLVAIPFAETRK